MNVLCRSWTVSCVIRSACFSFRSIARLRLSSCDEVGEERRQLDRGQRRELGVLVEEVEELSFPRQQAHGRIDSRSGGIRIIAFRHRRIRCKLDAASDDEAEIKATSPKSP